MERVSEEENHNKTSQQLKRNYREIISGEWPGAINIPLDLTVEILKKLPVKSLIRFRCVSKQWSTIVGSRKDFIDLIVTRSLAQPQHDYHFIVHNYSLSFEPSFLFSSTYPHKISRLVPVVEIMNSQKEIQYVRGLIGYWTLCFGRFTVHNLTTRQSLSLPHITSTLFPRSGRHYLFGYDPLENQYKVVCLPDYFFGQSCHVFTLGDPTKQWRNIQCSIVGHFPLISTVCINGTIYYKAMTGEWNKQICILVSFDVRSEKFNHVQTPQMLKDHLRRWTLVNYQGKLGCICHNFNEDVEMWVMEDAKKQEWLKTTLVSRSDLLSLGLRRDVRFPDVTPSGEIVIVHSRYVGDALLDIYYYDPKENSYRSIEIETTALGKIDRTYPLQIWAVPVHVENTTCS